MIVAASYTYSGVPNRDARSTRSHPPIPAINPVTPPPPRGPLPRERRHTNVPAAKHEHTGRINPFKQRDPATQPHERGPAVHGQRARYGKRQEERQVERETKRRDA